MKKQHGFTGQNPLKQLLFEHIQAKLQGNPFAQSSCITAYNSKNSQAEIESSPARNYVYGTARELFELISRQHDLQTLSLHIHQAIDDCFNNPDPLILWSRGIHIFKI